MEIKKSPNSDLENKKSVFFILGLTLVLGVILLSFEWTSGDVEVQELGTVQEVEFEAEEVPITRQEEPEPQKVEQPKPQVVEEIEIVEDEAEVEEVVIEDTEVDEDTEIEIVEVEEEEEEEEEEIFVVVEDPPMFPGGMLELRKYIANNLEYPEIAREMGISGRVIVQFVVDKNGKVTNAVVVRSVDKALDQAALKVVNSMPAWKPGKQRGEAVKVRYTLPVSFVLQ